MSSQTDTSDKRRASGDGSKSDSRRRDSKSARLERVVVRNLSTTAIHRRLLGLVMMSTLLALAVCVVSASIAFRRVPPQYIQVQADSRLLPVSPLSQPNLDDAGISAFALEAIQALNTYDYLNWRDQINQAQIYFTPDGWGKYKGELDRVGTMRAVEERKQIVSFRPEGPVRVASKGLATDGFYTWDVEVPAVVSYVGHAQKMSAAATSNRQQGVIRLRIKRIPLALSDKGVAISGYGYTLTR